MPLISVIIPVYNCGEPLKKCVDSIIRQTFHDFELILIDDGSTDGITPVICDGYAASLDYIKVLHGPNGGISTARNRGLDAACGKWIYFQDGDDWADDFLLEQLVSKAEDCDMVVNRPYGKCRKMKHLEEMEMGTKASLDTIMRHFGFFTVWGGLYRRDLIEEHGLRFDTHLRLNEDVMFNYDYLCHCRKIRFANKPGYHYTGEWGGDILRYAFSAEDTCMMMDVYFKTMGRLAKACNTALPIRHMGNYCDHIGNVFGRYTDMDLCRMFIEHIPLISEEEYFCNKYGKHLGKTGLKRMKRMWKEGHRKEAMALAHDLHRHFTRPADRISLKWNYKLVYRLIQREHYGLVKLLMPVFSRT